MRPKAKPRAVALPWDNIMEEVEQAARKIATSRQISAGRIAEHIDNSPVGDYPHITAKGEWHPADILTSRAIVNRVNRAIALLGWKAWNDGRATNRNGKTFILPWMPEDPLIVKAREEVMAGAD